MRPSFEDAVYFLFGRQAWQEIVDPDLADETETDERADMLVWLRSLVEDQRLSVEDLRREVGRDEVRRRGRPGRR